MSAADDETSPDSPNEGASQFSPLPFGVKLAAGLLILSGLEGVAHIVMAILGESTEGGVLNLIFLFIGFGLLRRSTQSLGCATALFGLLTFAMIAGGIALAIPSCRASMDFDSVSAGELVFMLIPFAALTILTFYLLRNPEVKSAFGVKPSESALGEARSWGWILVIISGSALFDSYHSQYLLENIIDGAFEIDTVIEVGDAEVGGLIEGVSLGSSSSSSEKYRPRIWTSTASTSSWRLRGFAFFPVSYRLSADGYEALEVEIDGDTPRELYVKLRRIPESPATESGPE